MQKQLIAVLLAGGIAFAAQAADFPKEINITYVKAPFNLQNIVMKEQGLLEKAFEKDGVKVNWRVINSGADQSLAMASGALDFSAVMNTASLLLGAGAGNPIAIATGVAHPEKIFAMVGKPGSNLTVKDLKGPGSNLTVKDLKGKTVGGPKGTVLHQMLVAALAKEGMTINDVNCRREDRRGPRRRERHHQGQCRGREDHHDLRRARRAEPRHDGAQVLRLGISGSLCARDRGAPQHLEVDSGEQGRSARHGREGTGVYEWSNFYDVLNEGDIQGLEKDMKFLIDNGMMKKSLDVRSLVLPSAMK